MLISNNNLIFCFKWSKKICIYLHENWYFSNIQLNLHSLINMKKPKWPQVNDFFSKMCFLIIFDNTICLAIIYLRLDILGLYIFYFIQATSEKCFFNNPDFKWNFFSEKYILHKKYLFGKAWLFMNTSAWYERLNLS